MLLAPCLCLIAQVDIVPPPTSWSIAALDISEYTHINLLIERIYVHRAMGVLGETAQLRYDAQGDPIMKASGPNGEGLLLHPPEMYEVTSLFEPMHA